MCEAPPLQMVLDPPMRCVCEHYATSNTHTYPCYHSNADMEAAGWNDCQSLQRAIAERNIEHRSGHHEVSMDTCTVLHRERAKLFDLH